MSTTIKSKVYYNKTTGQIYGVTDECYDSTGQINIPSLEDNLKNYKFLNGVDENTLESIELEYGEYAKLLFNSKSYCINLESKKLDIIYYTHEELEELRKQHEQQNQETQILNNKISTISEYLNQDISSISDIENYILKKEQNKILGVI